MSSDAERWSRVRALFEAADARPAGEREGWLRDSCGGDAGLEAEVLSLLEASEKAGAFLETPAWTPPERRSVGAYTIVREIGHGGMGTVFLAVRSDGDFRRQVALKLVRRGMDTDFVVARFRTERRILAGLDHPYIARLLDGGTTEDGLPYFVMEYVDGEPIDRWCREKKLATSERIALFRQVCAAVQYAHQHLVVHRDLKPGNIFVARDGTPRLLDFGIAKLLGDDETGETVPQTATHMRLLTPEYASPEQLRGEAVTTASDVYALGVLLYELLTGTRPHRLPTRSPEEVARAVLEEEPIRPSSRTKGIDSDLETIVLTALRKEPARRYASAEQLAEDLRRWVSGLPVKARRDTFVYRTSKFVRRHRIGVGAAALVVVSLLGGVLAASRQAAVARQERARAERRYAELRRLVDSFLFEFHDEIQYIPGTVKARALVVKRALQYLNRMSDENLGDAGVTRDLAAAYQKIANAQSQISSASLGDAVAARRSYRHALALREQVAREHPENVDDQRALATILGQTSQMNDVAGDRAGALAAARAAWEIRQRVLALKPGDPETRRETAVTLHYLATALGESGAYEEAISAYRREADLFRGLLPASPKSNRFRWGLAAALQGEAQQYVYAARAREAAPSLRDCLTRLEELDRDLPQHVSVRRGLAGTYALLSYAEERPADAIAWARKALAVREEISAKDPADADARQLVAESRVTLARLLARSGERRESRKLLEAAREPLAALLTKEPANLPARTTLAESLLGLGETEPERSAPACGRFREASALLAAAETRLGGDGRRVYSQSRAALSGCPVSVAASGALR